MLTAAYLINRTPSTVLKGKTPYEYIYNKPPMYSHLRVLGALCYAHNQNHHGDKFETRSRRCVFTGYPHSQKGWRLFDLEKQEFFVSRDVIFYETEFPYLKSLERDKVFISNNEFAAFSASSPNLGLLEDIGPSTIRPILSKPIVENTAQAITPPIVQASAPMLNNEIREVNLTPSISPAPTSPETVAQPIPNEPALGRGH